MFPARTKRLIAGHALLAALTLLLAAVSPLAAAQGLPMGMSTVSAGCGPSTGAWTTAGPSGAGLQLPCDDSAVGINYYGQPYSYQSASSVNTFDAVGERLLLKCDFRGFA